MKNIFIIICLIASVLTTYSQTEKQIKYLDLTGKEITKRNFKKKLKVDYYEVITQESDSVITKKLRLQVYFGHLGFEKKEQLNRLFKKRYGIDKNKTWVIRYYDSLPDLNRRKDSVIIQEYSEPKEREKYKYWKTTYDHFDKRVSERKSKYRKIKNVELINFYGYNRGFQTENDKILTWCKDEGNLIQKLFNDGQTTYKTIIIFRHGDYLVFDRQLSFNAELELLDFKEFVCLRNGYKKELNRAR